MQEFWNLDDSMPIILFLLISEATINEMLDIL